ncbi:MAG TPA: hypothetical protein V6C52_11285 [Coleofasciculaceae cyanobacterium]|jgi:hypothetical protein
MKLEQPKTQPAETQLPEDLPNSSAEPGFVPASFEPQPESLASPPQGDATPEQPENPTEFPNWSEAPISPAHPAIESETTVPAKPSQSATPAISPQQAASKPQPAKKAAAKPAPKDAHPVVKEPIPLVPDTPVPADWVQKPTESGKTMHKTSQPQPEPGQQPTASSNTSQASAPTQMPAATDPSAPTTRIVVTDKTVIPEVIAPPDETKKPSKMPANIPAPMPAPVLGKVEFTTEAQPAPAAEPASSETGPVAPLETQAAFTTTETGQPAPQNTDINATQPAEETVSNSTNGSATDASGAPGQANPTMPTEAARIESPENLPSAATATKPATSPVAKQASQSNPAKPGASKPVASASKKGKQVVHFPELPPDDTGHRKHPAAPRKAAAKASVYAWPKDYKPYLPPPDVSQREIHTQAVHHFNRGNYYGRKKNLEQAVAEYRRAVVLNPAFADAYVGLSSVHVLKNDWESVYEETAKALSLKKGGFMDPANIVQAKFNLTMAHCASAEKGDALKTYRQVKLAGHPLSQQLWIYMQHSCKP